METEHYKLLHESNLFDYDFYLSKNQDVALSGVDPLTHYLDYGAKEGRDPNLLFNHSYYLSQCPDLPNLDISALAHYIIEGQHKLNPHIMFDTKFYLHNYSEVTSCGITPLAHFLKIGAYCDYDPCQKFDTSFYLAQDPQIRAYGINPLVHYILYGHNESRYTRNTFIDDFPDSLIEDYKLLTELEPLLPKVELLSDLPLIGFRKNSRTGAAYFKLIKRLIKPFSILFIMPDLQSSGTQVRETLKSISAHYLSEDVLLLLTDSTMSKNDKLADSYLTITTLADLDQKLTISEKAKILVRLIIQTRPHIVYNGGSEAADEVFSDFRKPLERFTKLINI
jgi:hypothetical protein